MTLIVIRIYLRRASLGHFRYLLNNHKSGYHVVLFHCLSNLTHIEVIRLCATRQQTFYKNSQVFSILR